MAKEVIECLYCQSKNEIASDSEDVGNFEHCGMPLTRDEPESRCSRVRHFLPFFW